MNPKNQVYKFNKRLPVLLVEVPCKPTVRSMNSATLAALGYSQVVHNSAHGTMYIHELFKIYGVERLILDDFHHMFSGQPYRQMQRLADWLRDLITQTTVEVETRGSLDPKIVFNLSPQLARRLYMYPRSRHSAATTDLKT